jgi:hypothetical protein
VVAGLAEELYEGPRRDPRDYFLIDARGRIQQHFTVTTWSIEDELGASVFDVIDGALHKLSVSIIYSDPVRVKRSRSTVIDGLQVVADDERETLQLLSVAVSFHESMIAEGTRRLSLAADARVAAIPGAGDDYGIGEEFRLAQEVLSRRVKAYGTRIDRALLGALARLGDVRRSVSDSGGPGKAALAAIDTALDSFARACRIAAFDLPPRKIDPTSPPAPAPDPIPKLSEKDWKDLHELGETLRALERDLLEESEAQDLADARNNAIAYWSAAAQIARASGIIGTIARGMT